MPVTMDAKKLIHNDKTTGGTVTIRASKTNLNPSQGGKSGTITLRGRIAYVKSNSAIKEKEARLEERNRLIEAAETKAASPGMSGTEEGAKLHAAADRLKENNVAVERARLADNVYNTDPSSAPPGWERIEDHPGDDGFHAATYRSQIDGTEVLVFEGTTMTSLDDWAANLGQGAGLETSQYKQAIELAKAAKITNPNIQLAGHSLGGGLASAGASVSGAPTWTFNSAGLHPKTSARAGGNYELANQVTKSWQIAGEILGSVQTYGDLLTKGIGAYIGSKIGGPLGGVVGAALAPGVPDAVGELTMLEPAMPGGTFDKHRMEHVIKSIEAEKTQDIATMKQAI